MMEYDPTVSQVETWAFTDPYEYMDPFVQQISEINIRDFDFDIFKAYIEELNAEEFQTIWDTKFENVMKIINDQYLVVDIEEFEKSSADVMQVMFIEYIEFIMNVLPYKIVFAKYLKNNFNSLTELQKWLEIKNISNDLSLLLQDDIVVIKNMYKLLKDTISDSRKSSEYLPRAEKLKSYIEYENNFRDYFIGIVEDTDNEMLKNLILKYYESEFL